METQGIFIGTDWIEFVCQALSESKSQRPMLVCGKHMLKYRELLDFIKNSHEKFVLYTDFQSNPDYDSAVNAAKLCKKNLCDFIIAIGGGSAIDIAKCARRFSQMNLEQDCLEKQPLVTSSIKMLAAPTTAGSGSEATCFAVLYRNHKKYSVAGDDLLPDYVLLNPAFLQGLSVYHKKSCYLDALCQAVESWWSLQANKESACYSEKAIKLLLKSFNSYCILQIEDEKSTYTDVLLGAHYAGKAINLTTTTAAHAMSYGLTTMFGIAHGHAVALCITQVWQQLLKVNDNHLNTVLDRIAAAFGCETKEDSFLKFRSLLDKLEMPRLENVTKEAITQLAETVNLQRLSNHPFSLSYSDLYKMYEGILSKA